MSGRVWEAVAAELGRVAVAAARATVPLRGCGDDRRIDQAAVDAMRSAFAQASLEGVVVLGEGEKDQAPLLAAGERLGRGDGPPVDIAVDPIDGTHAAATDAPGALTAVGACARGRMWTPSSLAYVDKLAVGPEAAGHVDLARPLDENLRAIAAALGRGVREVTVALLDRPRNRGHAAAVRGAGAQLVLLPHADLAASVSMAIPGRGIDVVTGIGGTPEALLAACAMTCVGGDLQVRPFFRDAVEREAAGARGIGDGEVLRLAELVDGSHVAFAAAGVTGSLALDAADGPLVQFVTLTPGRRSVGWS